MAVRRATAIGGSAILVWSTLALLTTWSGDIPPFQLVAMAFAVASAVGLGVVAVRGRGLGRVLRQPVRAWILGVAGLFGYHALYFAALKFAPAVEANLLNYLWPLLIVLFSALLPGEGLSRRHIAGALAGFAGTVLLVTGGSVTGCPETGCPETGGPETGGGGIAVAAGFLPGYGAAVACAVTWAAYSVLSRRLGAVPTEAVGGFCLATAVLAAVCHLGLERTVTPVGGQWIAVLAMGLGPVGAAFFVWDYGVKHGDIRTLGTLSYATPLLSTWLLMAFGQAAGGAHVWGACALIVGGGMVALGGGRPVRDTPGHGA
jgi:drug/metabolite transporter (DMT)-like permease